MMLRIYALYGRNVRFLACFLALSTPFLAVIVWSIVGHDRHFETLPGCHVSVSVATAHQLSAGWGAFFLYDSLIFGLTVGKTYATWRRADSQEYMPIHSLIFRDGALYFAAMAMSNLCNIVTYYISGPILAGSLSTFASCVSVTIMSRLMLNLHEKAHVGVLTHLSFDDDVVLGAIDLHPTKPTIIWASRTWLPTRWLHQRSTPSSIFLVGRAGLLFFWKPEPQKPEEAPENLS
ncbi:hypothetical protein DFH09DRAFT_1363982 [Mycena vulgaris]|nr:hypothetical protein DFH09DRAFT_1363982 [Mycena vulgaris]